MRSRSCADLTPSRAALSNRSGPYTQQPMEGTEASQPTARESSAPWIIVPTYDEAENLATAVAAILAAVPAATLPRRR